MSDFSIGGNNLEKYAKSAFHTMAGLFDFNPIMLTVEDAVSILISAYK